MTLPLPPGEERILPRDLKPGDRVARQNNVFVPVSKVEKVRRRGRIIAYTVHLEAAEESSSDADRAPFRVNSHDKVLVRRSGSEDSDA